MKPTDLRTFLETGKLLTIYEWAQQKATYSLTKSDEDIVSEQLKSFAEKRRAFDSGFVTGSEPLYGALNINEGMGATHYGEYCAVLNANQLMAKGNLGYLKSDSLRDYVSSSGTVDEQAVSENCSSDAGKQYLATLKHKDELGGAPPDSWPSILCNNSEYVEAIFDVKAGYDELVSVRIAKADFELYWDFAFEEFESRLGELDRYRVDAFGRMTELLRQRGLDWEIIG